MVKDIDKDIEDIENEHKKYQRLGFFGVLGDAVKKAYVDPAAAKLKELMGQEQAPEVVQQDPRLAAIQQIKQSYSPQEADDVLARARALREQKETNLGNPADAPAPAKPTQESLDAAELRKFAKTLEALQKSK